MRYLFILPIFLLACAGISDRDLDGIPDKLDECPQSTEDKDAFQDNDGCPDLDNDKDGVSDSKDKCPLIAEDRDGHEDGDGCPDTDNDGDGLPDLRDRCPADPEDRDGFEDADGCPEKDNDGDGVLDSTDQCPMDAEDKDGFEDADGCAELDNDKDGIKDSFDKCPNNAEILNGREDEDGCPDTDAEALPEQMELPLRFETGTAQLTFEDNLILETKVVPGLLAHPEHRIYVYVFLPNVDLEPATYLELLNQRTLNISLFLQSKGVPPSQVRTRTITDELLKAQAGTPMDFNATKPVLLKRKNNQ